MKRPTMAPAAVTVSDRTCEAVLGVPWRTLRAFLQERGIAIPRIGRRPVVRVDAVLAALEGSEARPAWDPDKVVELAARSRR